jgi:8-hydroxy-5-deazaflavin:NADPH oxidoreductase
VLGATGDLSGKAIVTCSLPMDAANTRLVLGHTTSGAEALARRVPGARVVSAFNTIPSEVLFGVFAARAKAPPPSMLYCGDDPASKDVAATLIRDVGFEAIDAGPLASARYTEPLAMIIAHLAYEGEGGPELAYRIERFGRGE